MPVSGPMEETPVLAALEGGVLTLTLNRPTRLNAMSHPLIEAMNAQLKRAREDDAVRAILLTGTGRGFCAGADLAGPGPGDPTTSGERDVGAVMDRIFNPMIRAMRELPKPIVAAVNGVAAGGGANLALACDIVLAARSARFDQAFVRISLIPDLGAPGSCRTRWATLAPALSPCWAVRSRPRKPSAWAWSGGSSMTPR